MANYNHPFSFTFFGQYNGGSYGLPHMGVEDQPASDVNYNASFPGFSPHVPPTTPYPLMPQLDTQLPERHPYNVDAEHDTDSGSSRRTAELHQGTSLPGRFGLENASSLPHLPEVTGPGTAWSNNSGRYRHDPISKRRPYNKRALTLHQKQQICLEAERHPKRRQEEIARMFGVERSTVSKILKNSYTWLNMPSNSQEGVKSFHKFRKAKYDNLESAMLSWLENMKTRHEPITDAKIRNAALAVQRKYPSIAGPEFKASGGWIENYKHRHGIKGGVCKPPSDTSPVKEEVAGDFSSHRLFAPHSVHSPHSSYHSPAPPDWNKEIDPSIHGELLGDMDEFHEMDSPQDGVNRNPSSYSRAGSENCGDPDVNAYHDHSDHTDHSDSETLTVDDVHMKQQDEMLDPPGNVDVGQERPVHHSDAHAGLFTGEPKESVSVPSSSNEVQISKPSTSLAPFGKSPPSSNVGELNAKQAVEHEEALKRLSEALVYLDREGVSRDLIKEDERLAFSRVMERMHDYTAV